MHVKKQQIRLQLHTAPMVIGTFLENYDLTGVEVYPFTQSSSMDEEQFN